MMARENLPLIEIDNVTYTEKQVREVMEQAIANAKRTGKAKTIYRLKRDLVIPAGTEWGLSTPGETRKLVSVHAVLEVPISKDTTMSITMDLADAILTELIEKRMVL